MDMYKIPRKTVNENGIYVYAYQQKPVPANDGTQWRVKDGKVEIEGWFGTYARGFEVHLRLTRSDLLDMTRALFRELEADLREARKAANNSRR